MEQWKSEGGSSPSQQIFPFVTKHCLELRAYKGVLRQGCEQATVRASERGFIMNKGTYLRNETFELALKDCHDFSRSKAS